MRLPFPPSVNNYWRSRVARNRNGKMFTQYYISPNGKQYRQKVVAAAIDAGHYNKHLAGPLGVRLDLIPPTAGVYDWDNSNKALFDALGAAGLYADDSQIESARIEKYAGLKPGCVVVSVWEKGSSGDILLQSRRMTDHDLPSYGGARLVF
jgi:Holliday junction resolvase RusA-like endonuclease